MIPVSYISGTIFAAAGNVTPYYGKGQRATCYQGVNGNVEVTIVSASYVEADLLTYVTVIGGTLYGSIYEVSLGDTYSDEANNTGNICEHFHSNRSGGGSIPASSISEAQVTTLKTVDIPQTADSHKLVKVCPTAADGYQLATLAGTSNRVSVTLADGTITLTGPQDQHTAASPTYAGLTLSGLTGIMEAKGASAVAIVASTGSLQILRRNSGNTAYEFALVNVADLGDATITSAAAGDILYRNASNKWVNLAKANDGDTLTLSSGLPAWITLALKHLSDVADTVTDSGAAGDILVRGASTYDRLAVGTDGKALIISPSTHLPAYGLPTMKLADLSDGYGQVFTLTMLCT